MRTPRRVTLAKRLLHAGAPARDIVHQFVSVMRVLHEMDASGETLTFICLSTEPAAPLVCVTVFGPLMLPAATVPRRSLLQLSVFLPAIAGSLAAAITPPICAYLRGRPDTARCVVQLVTKGDGEGQPSLLDEAQQVGAMQTMLHSQLQNSHQFHSCGL